MQSQWIQKANRTYWRGKTHVVQRSALIASPGDFGFGAKSHRTSSQTLCHVTQGNILRSLPFQQLLQAHDVLYVQTPHSFQQQRILEGATALRVLRDAFPTGLSAGGVPHQALLEIQVQGPGWCSSMDWARACEPKGPGFGSQPGHTPGFRARSPVGGA